MSKKILSVVCLLLCALIVFSACGSGSADVGNSVLYEQKAGDGIFAYDLVRSATGSDEVESMVVDMRKAIKNGLGLKVVLQRDTVEDATGKYELLIGETNRPESIECAEMIKNNRANNLRDFVIKCFDYKICIVALTDETLQKAVDLFIDTFCGSAEDWAKLGRNFEYFYAPDATGVHLINDQALGQYTIVSVDKAPYIYSYYLERLDDVYAYYNYPSLRAVDTDPVTDYEILVGDIFRPESKAVELTDGDFVIKVQGTKLIIKGSNDLATSHGVQKLLDMVDENPNGINLKDGYVYNGNIADDPDGYQYATGDEFDGTSFDPKFWSSMITGGGGDGGFGENDLSEDTAVASQFGGKVYYKGISGCFKSDGNLVITSGLMPDNPKNCWQSGISSGGKWGVRYGIIDIWSKAAKAPAGTSLWFNGFEDVGCFVEINLVETAGRDFEHVSNVHRWATSRDQNNVSTGFFHTAKGSATYPGVITPVFETPVYEEWHMYSFFWDRYGIHFAVDGETFFDFDLTKEEGQTMLHTYSHMHLCSHLGEAKYANHRRYEPDKDGTYFEGYVDYFRIYQDKDGGVSTTMRLDKK